MPKPAALPSWVYLKGVDVDIPTMRDTVVTFVQQREVAAAREAIKALHDCVALKKAIHLPVLAETYRAVQQLEDEIASLKVALVIEYSTLETRGITCGLRTHTLRLPIPQGVHGLQGIAEGRRRLGAALAGVRLACGGAGVYQVDAGPEGSVRLASTLLGYLDWDNFKVAIKRAKAAAKNTGALVTHHFADARKVTDGGRWGSQEVADHRLSRDAAYLIAMNGDPRKPEVAEAQTYFAVKTREAEIVQQQIPQSDSLISSGDYR